MKILICFGTRPEAIKMAPIYHALKQQKYEVYVCVTAQHREMLDQVLAFFEIIVNEDLDLMTPNQSLNQLSSRILEKMDGILELFKPDLVLVHGDTTTSTMVALAAFHKQIKVGHIEAGLRTYDKKAPFPEEINRQLTSRISDLHFAPTKTAEENLLNEGIPASQILITGNTVIDALYFTLSKIEKKPQILDKFLVDYFENEEKVILMTMHRRENMGDGFVEICNAINIITKNNQVRVLLPLHLNPKVQTIVRQILGSNIKVTIIAPLDYPNFVYAMNKSYLILTDSGGVQEEAPSLGKPVLVLREKTERPEAVVSGNVKLVGTNQKYIIQETELLLNNSTVYKRMSNAINPYGDGKAVKRIQNFIEDL